jgi:hypothetical protein
MNFKSVNFLALKKDPSGDTFTNSSWYKNVYNASIRYECDEEKTVFVMDHTEYAIKKYGYDLVIRLSVEEVKKSDICSETSSETSEETTPDTSSDEEPESDEDKPDEDKLDDKPDDKPYCVYRCHRLNPNDKHQTLSELYEKVGF